MGERPRQEGGSRPPALDLPAQPAKLIAARLEMKFDEGSGAGGAGPGSGGAGQVAAEPRARARRRGAAQPARLSAGTHQFSCIHWMASCSLNCFSNSYSCKVNTDMFIGPVAAEPLPAPKCLLPPREPEISRLRPGRPASAVPQV